MDIYLTRTLAVRNESIKRSSISIRAEIESVQMNQQFTKNSPLRACLNRAMRMSVLNALFILPSNTHWLLINTKKGTYGSCCHSKQPAEPSILH